MALPYAGMHKNESSLKIAVKDARGEGLVQRDFRAFSYFLISLPKLICKAYRPPQSLLNSGRRKYQAVEVDFGIDPELALVEGYSGHSQLGL